MHLSCASNYGVWLLGRKEVVSFDVGHEDDASFTLPAIWKVEVGIWLQAEGTKVSWTRARVLEALQPSVQVSVWLA